MSWNWQSPEEYLAHIEPICVETVNLIRGSKHRTTAQTWSLMSKELYEFSSALEKLESFSECCPETKLDKESSHALGETIFKLIFHGERLLGYNKRLGTTEEAERFNDSKTLIKDLRLPVVDQRFVVELKEFQEDCHRLSHKFSSQEDEDKRFLADELQLPDELCSDFVTARNLFSVGLEEMGMFAIGRGFERVLREIARRKRLKLLDAKNNQKPLDEADLRDIIEAFYRLNWKDDGSRLIDLSTKAFLDYLRTLRNSVAHPAKSSILKGWRNEAIIATQKASDIWNQVMVAKRTIKLKAVQRAW